VDGNCQAPVPNVLGGVTVSDGCTAAGAITLSQSPMAGTLVGVGAHTITVTATDEVGNSATCATTFTVTDSTAPSVNCSAVPAANADGNCQAPVPNVLGGATVSDGCTAAGAIALSQSPAAGTLVGVGVHTITVTATDGAGNSATCTTTFTVEGAATIVADGPTDLVRYVGLSATFSTTPLGNGPFRYQWRKDGVDMAGETNSTCTIPSLSATDTGVYSVIVTGPCASVTNYATLTVNNCLPLTSDTPKLNPQSGLFVQKARVSNPTDSSFSAVRISVTGLLPGVQVHNASGDVDGVPFVKFNQELGPGEVTDLTIEYYVPDRRTPAPELCARPVSISSPTQQIGTPVTIDRVLRLADGTTLIEFAAVPGQVYYIQYCDDLRNWKTVTPGVTSGANRIQWIDNGQPKTESFPSDRVSRFYRVIRVP
jgi:hypothetical protein